MFKLCMRHTAPIFRRRLCSNLFSVANYYTFRIQYSNAIKNRFKTFMLWWQDDPDFNLKLFKEGAKQAISVITDCLRDDKRTCPYLSTFVDNELRKSSQTWHKLVRKNVYLKPNEVRQIIISDVQRTELSDALVYEITTFGIGYKQYEQDRRWLWQIILRTRCKRRNKVQRFQCLPGFNSIIISCPPRYISCMEFLRSTLSL